MKISSKKSASYRNMDDLEIVLRFLTMFQRWEKFGKKISTAMDDFMAENRNADIAQYRSLFNKAINSCERIWGEHAFEKPQNGGCRE